MEAAEYALMDDAEDRMWWYRALHGRLIQALAGAPGPILDAGCGTGGLLARLERPDSMGLEFDEAAAIRAAGKSHRPVARGSINAIPFAEGTFGAVVSADVLSHAAVDPAVALGELHRVLKPDGLLVLNLPAYQWMLSAHDRRVHNVRRFTTGAVAAMLASSGFATSRVRYWNGLLLPAMMLQRLVLSAKSDSPSDVAAFSPWLNATLYGITAIEQHLPFSPPAGGSVLAIATRSNGRK